MGSARAVRRRGGGYTVKFIIKLAWAENLGCFPGDLELYEALREILDDCPGGMYMGPLGKAVEAVEKPANYTRLSDFLGKYKSTFVVVKGNLVFCVA